MRSALALYESRVRAGVRPKGMPRRVAEELEEASKAVRKKDPKWAMISEIVERASTPIEDFSSAMWGKEI